MSDEINNNGNEQTAGASVAVAPRLLSREQILAAGRVKTAVVAAWGGQVRIQELSAAQAASIGSRSAGDTVRAMAMWVVAAVIDEEGKMLFTQEDEEAVLQMGASDVMAVGAEVLKLNGLGKDQAEQQVKNSDAQSTVLASA